MSNKRKADLTLLGLFFLFLAILFVRHYWPEVVIWRFLSFVVEASLVGGIADWFAVTALFRRPLGFPFHTAVIPRNRPHLVSAVAELVEKELLSPEVLRQQIEQLDLCQSLIYMVDHQGGNDRLANLLSEQANRMIARMDPKQTANFLAALLQQQARGEKLLPALWQFVDCTMTESALNLWINRLLDYGEEVASAPQFHEYIVTLLNQVIQDYIRDKVANQISGPLISVMNTAGTSIMEDAATELHKHLLLYIRRLQNNEHPWRGVLNEQIFALLNEYKENPLKAKQLADRLEEVVSQLPLEEVLEQMVGQAVHWAVTPTEQGLKSPLHEWITSQFALYWHEFKTNSGLQSKVNRFLSQNLSNLVNAQHALIGKIVTEALLSLSDEELNRFVESKVGEDLHWIRLNGSLIGALAGVLVFCFLNFIYGPLVAPMVLKWFP